MAQKNLEDVLKTPEIRSTCCAIRGSEPMSTPWSQRVLELARRAGRLAQDLCLVRSVASHGGHLHRRAGRAEAGFRPRDQQLRELPRQPRQAIHPVQLQRPRDRRRHPVPPREEQARVRRPRADRRTGFSSTRRPASTTSRSRRTTVRPATRRARPSTASPTASRSRARTRGRSSRS